MSKKNNGTTFRLTAAFTEFVKSETSGGIVLLICTAVALAWANSSWSNGYFHLWESPLSIGIGQFSLTKTLIHWINDGLMVIFFFFVGLEIKREIVIGELSSVKKAMLPIIAALGGMIGPALIFLAFNGSDPVNAHGWGIPMATDIAFALGILAMLGNRVPPSLKIFLAALAIADDMGAVLVIALFYTSELSLIMLAAGGVFFVLLLISNRFNIRSTAVYTLLGIGLWFCFLKSGIHATIAGVLLATTIPVASGTEKKKKDHPHHDEHSPLHRFEHALQPYVAFLIMPIFAVANAGVKIEGSITDALFSPLGNGILFGLIAGKQIGIVSFVWIAVKLKLAELPKSVTWGMIYGTSWLCAIGFTMALFIAGLAFTSNEPLVISKIAVLSASIAAGVGGFIILRSMTSMQKH